MRVLVTGAGGFLGSNLVRELLREDYQVRALVRKGGNMANLSGLDIEVVIGDLGDVDSLARAATGCRVVYHTAALYSERDEDEHLVYRTNLDGTKDLLDVARRVGVDRVVHTSTIGTVGRCHGRSLPTEDTVFNLWDSSSHYVRSKYLAEVEVMAANGNDLETVVVNPCAPVGRFDSRPSPTGRRIVSFLMGMVPPYPREGINFIDVRDVARGHVLAAQKGQAGQKYILGHRNLSLEEFLELMETVSGQPKPVAPKVGLKARLLKSCPLPGHRSTGPTSLTACCSRAVWDLGLPQSKLEDAFKEAVSWFRERGYVQGRTPALV